LRVQEIDAIAEAVGLARIARIGTVHGDGHGHHVLPYLFSCPHDRPAPLARRKREFDAGKAGSFGVAISEVLDFIESALASRLA
jgi:hypothetical protein